MMRKERAMKYSLSAIGGVAFACMLAQPAAAWVRGGTTGVAGHSGAGANGHEASGTYATTSKPTHQARSPGGGAAEAGHANSASYGTTTYGTRYAIGSHGWVVAANDGHVVAIGTGPYAYRTHDGGGPAYGGAHRPPMVVSPYYGAGCYDCGGWGGGAVTPATLTVTYANASLATLALASPAYAALPVGYAYRPIGGTAYYFRDGIWFSPHGGANGMDDRAFPR
jgi:hypothetical protein